MLLLQALLIYFFTTPLLQVQAPEVIQSLEYREFTRGYSLCIQLTPNEISVTKTGQSPQNYTKAIAAEEWQNLVKLLDAALLSNISTLSSPTHKRHSDGALHATLKINTNQTEKITPSFDSDSPPAVLAPLLKELLLLSKKN